MLKFGFLGGFYRGQNTRGLMIWSLFFGGCVRKQRSRERKKRVGVFDGLPLPLPLPFCIFFSNVRT